MTEVSNLSRQIGEPIRSRIAQTLRQWVQTPEVVDEKTVASAAAMSRPEFQRLGLTDSVLLALATQKFEILTADLDLYLAALTAGYPATNFNHLRGL